MTPPPPPPAHPHETTQGWRAGVRAHGTQTPRTREGTTTDPAQPWQGARCKCKWARWRGSPEDAWGGHGARDSSASKQLNNARQPYGPQLQVPRHHSYTLGPTGVASPIPALKGRTIPSPKERTVRRMGQTANGRSHRAARSRGRAWRGRLAERAWLYLPLGANEFATDAGPALGSADPRGPVQRSDRALGAVARKMRVEL
jgi:hypothetical protein